MNNETNKYIVTFCYSVIVEADDYDNAEDEAHNVFSAYLSAGLSAGDFAMSDVEDWGY